MVVGVGINAAHELGHKHESLEHWASKPALAPTWYGHFFVEHNWGHHTDHHENPARRFVALRHVPEAPQLPAGAGQPPPGPASP